MPDPTIPVPFLPQDPNRVTAVEVEKMIDARLLSFWRSKEESIKGISADAKRKNLYKTAAIAVAGFVLGVGSSMAVSRFKSGRTGAAMTTARPLTAVK